LPRAADRRPRIERGGGPRAAGSRATRRAAGTARWPNCVSEFPLRKVGANENRNIGRPAPSAGPNGSNPSLSSEESRTNRPAARRGSAWRVLDALDYWLTLTRLRILDALCGEGVEMTADEWEQALRLKSSDCSAPRSPSLPRSRPWRLITLRGGNNASRTGSGRSLARIASPRAHSAACASR
jgi:hypothetical protein